MAKGKKRQRKSKVEETKIETVDEKMKLQDSLFVVFCIVMFFVAFYLLTLYITNKHSDNNNEEVVQEAQVSYDDIMLGRSLSMKEKDYLVIFYESGNAEVSGRCSEAVKNYRDTNTKALYFVDMSDGFNSSYVAEGESNKNPESAKDLSINGPTVIHVSKGKVIEYIEGIDAVIEYLK